MNFLTSITQNRNLSFLLIIAVVLSFTVFQSCEKSPRSVQEKGMEENTEIMRDAMGNVPVPEINNYLTREYTAKWLERMDVPDKTFYIYLIADNGSIVGYHVAQYRPLSVGTYLTPTKRLHDDGSWGTSMPAPTLDGTYYGQGGANQYFFFDAETGAYVEIKGLNYLVYDQPLNIDVPKLTVKVDNNNG